MWSNSSDLTAYIEYIEDQETKGKISWRLTPVVKPKFRMFEPNFVFYLLWKQMHARVISETDARKGLSR